MAAITRRLSSSDSTQPIAQILLQAVEKAENFANQTAPLMAKKGVPVTWANAVSGIKIREQRPATIFLKP